VLEKLIKQDFISRRNHSDQKSVYDFTEKSVQSDYYNLLFSEKKISANRSLYNQTKSTDSKLRTESLNNINAVVDFMKNILHPESILVEIGGGVHQERSGYIYKEFINYYPLDISQSSIKKYVEKYNRTGVIADANKLPFENNSLDAIFTHTFLEHISKPEIILSEIARVLKPGGLVIHVDAWFCRWWQRFGVVGLKRFGEMTIKEKLISIGSQITELKLLRFPPIIIKRFINELMMDKSIPARFKYKKLKPNYELFLGCDEDAASSIDPISIINFYETRGFSNYQKLSFSEKLFFRSPYVIMQKKAH
jgi:ubiquinone/menaquinone biosynthesis C-methylase UbiE